MRKTSEVVIKQLNNGHTVAKKTFKYTNINLQSVVKLKLVDVIWVCQHKWGACGPDHVIVGG